MLSRLDRWAWGVFAAAAVAATVLILWFGRDATLSADEMTWFMQTPNLDLHGVLEPHIGHLILTTRLVYAAIFSMIGASYLPFQLLTIAVVVLTSALLFVYAGRRVGKAAALGPACVLLVFGSDPAHLLTGNGFTVIGALACGIGALVALDRDDRRGDLLACLLLCLGVVTYTVALPFVVGVAVAVLLRDDRRQRAWIFLVPLVVYGAWWLWSLGTDVSSSGQISPEDVLLVPSWSFQSLGAGLSALSGLDYPFSDEGMADAGSALALLAIGALVWSRRGRPVGRMLWAALAIAVTLWAMGALVSSDVRAPSHPRYLYPDALVILIAAAWAAAGSRWSSRVVGGILAVAAVGVMTNVMLLRDAGIVNRADAEQQRAVLAGIQVAGANAQPDFVPENSPGPILFSFGQVYATGTYLAAADRYGDVGYSPDELATKPEQLREVADANLVGALGLSLQPSEQKNFGECNEVPAGSPVGLQPPGSIALRSEAGGDVSLRRFADAGGASVGTLAPGTPAELTLPADDVEQEWTLTSTTDLRVCPATP
jgi:hypothetical protein